MDLNPEPLLLKATAPLDLSHNQNPHLDVSAYLFLCIENIVKEV